MPRDDEQITSRSRQEVQSLRAEIAHLRDLLSKSDTGCVRNFATSSISAQTTQKEVKATDHIHDVLDQSHVDIPKVNKGIADPRESCLTYYNQHTLLKFFYEVNIPL